MHQKQRRNLPGPARRAALLGLLLALALVLSVLEGMIPAVPGMVPGVKLGLSNIVTMYALFCLGVGESFLLAILKSLFVLLTRGAVAGLLSASGGIFSVAVMLAGAKLLRRGDTPYTFLSVLGGIFHNLGQLFMMSLLMGQSSAMYYLPVLLVSGFVMGLVTGLLLRTLMPYLQRTAGLLLKPDRTFRH